MLPYSAARSYFQKVPNDDCDCTSLSFYLFICFLSTSEFVFLQHSRHQTFDIEPKAYTFMESSFLQLTHTEILESIKPQSTLYERN